MKDLTELQLKALRDAASPINGAGLTLIGRNEWICNNSRYQATTVRALERAGYLTVRITGVAIITDAGREYLQAIESK